MKCNVCMKIIRDTALQSFIGFVCYDVREDRGMKEMSYVCCCRYYSLIFIRIASIYICPIIVLLFHPEDTRNERRKNVWQMFAVKHPKLLLQGVNAVMTISDR